MRLFLSACFCLLSSVAMALPADSLRTETIEGKLYIIHEVEPQETLFALSRRYNVSVDVIKRNNPIVIEGLKVGDVLRIPFYPQAKTTTEGRSHVVQAGETLYSISRLYSITVDDIKKSNDLLSGELSIGQELIIPEISKIIDPGITTAAQLPDTAHYQWHVVKQGETLFALSRMYSREISELVLWNKLSEQSIKIGDSLIINFTPKVKKPAEVPLANKEQEITAEPVASVEENIVVTREVVTNEANYEEIVETGLAELIDNSGDTQKYLALHRTAEIGTIIRVHNEMNGREVFVRVLGKLPDTGNNAKVLVKISQAAYDRLGAIDKRFRVRISYFPE